MISVTEVRLIFFQWAKTNPAAINRKTGMTGESGLKISIATKRFGRRSQRGEQDEAERFAELDHGAEIVGRKIAHGADLADFAPTK